MPRPERAARLRGALERGFRRGRAEAVQDDLADVVRDGSTPSVRFKVRHGHFALAGELVGVYARRSSKRHERSAHRHTRCGDSRFGDNKEAAAAHSDEEEANFEGGRHRRRGMTTRSRRRRRHVMLCCLVFKLEVKFAAREVGREVLFCFV